MRPRVLLALLPLAVLLGVVAGPTGDRTASAAERCRQGVTPATQRLRLVWTVRQRTQGCFFFSGPADLGRDVHLGTQATLSVSGTSAILDFGGGITFEGLRTGDQLRLRRVSTFQHGGPWDVDEWIEGTIRGNTLHATYRYAECERANGEGCREGAGCTIGAEIKACGSRG